MTTSGRQRGLLRFEPWQVAAVAFIAGMLSMAAVLALAMLAVR